MKLVKRYDYAKKPTVYSVADAAESTCYGGGQETGALEAAAATAEQTSRLLGQLMGCLHDKGILVDTDILVLLQSFTVAP